jgi:hypothetical protein
MKYFKQQEEHVVIREHRTPLAVQVMEEIRFRAGTLRYRGSKYASKKMKPRKP